MSADPNPWLLLIHRLPARPPYLRVKVWRRLQAVGAVPVQNAVYVLPNLDACREHFVWIVLEVQRHGGEASICEARMVEGLGDDALRAAFADARERDYRALAEEAEKLLEAPARKHGGPRPAAGFAATAARLRRRKAEIEEIDFFAAPGGDALERLIERLERRAGASNARATKAKRWKRSDVQGRTWVTRKGIHVDRIASAWLIRGWIDPEAHFAFVPARGYRPKACELRFDMVEGDFTHDGELCTFEVLLREFALDEPGLRPIAEIVHAIDLKVDEPARAETVGIAHVIEGIARRHADDEARLRDGATLFGALHAYFSAKGRRR